jgi:flagellar hook-length control protein FliK
MRDDALSLDIRTETEMGRHLVASRLDELQGALQRHGIVVERANVQMREALHEAPQAREQQSFQQPAQNPNQDAPGYTADQPRDSQHRGESAAGEDVPASSLPVEVVESADGATDGVGFSQTATESRVDMVA